MNGRSTKTFAQIQDELGKLVSLPKNLPVVYLLGDTGAGKTCLVRQLLEEQPQRSSLPLGEFAPQLRQQNLSSQMSRLSRLLS
jgi:Cdc6-like AAA superfamily ATPase